MSDRRSPTSSGLVDCRNTAPEAFLYSSLAVCLLWRGSKVTLQGDTAQLVVMLRPSFFVSVMSTLVEPGTAGRENVILDVDILTVLLGYTGYPSLSMGV